MGRIILKKLGGEKNKMGKGIIILKCKACKEIINKEVYNNVKWNGERVIEMSPEDLYDFKMIKHKCKITNHTQEIGRRNK